METRNTARFCFNYRAPRLRSGRAFQTLTYCRVSRARFTRNIFHYAPRVPSGVIFTTYRLPVSRATGRRPVSLARESLTFARPTRTTKPRGVLYRRPARTLRPESNVRVVAINANGALRNFFSFAGPLIARFPLERTPSVLRYFLERRPRENNFRGSRYLPGEGK